MLVAQKACGDFADFNSSVRMPEKLHGKFAFGLSGVAYDFLQNPFRLRIYVLHQAGRVNVAAADRYGMRFPRAFFTVGDSQNIYLSAADPRHQIEFKSGIVFFHQYFFRPGAGADFMKSAADFLRAVQHENPAGTVPVQRLCHYRKTEPGESIGRTGGVGFRIARSGNSEGGEHFFHDGFVPVKAQLFREKIAGKFCLCRNFYHTFQQQIGEGGENTVHPFLPAQSGDPVNGSDVCVASEIRFFFCGAVRVAVADNRKDSSGSCKLYQFCKFLG